MQDTFTQFAASLNAQLQRECFPPLTYEQAREIWRDTRGAARERAMMNFTEIESVEPAS